MADTLRHGTHNRGERSGKAKLSEDDVRIIKRLKGVVRYVDLAERFNVGYSTVAEIMRGKTWGWLE